MDQHNRLWAQLIFIKCDELHSLLALRAACRAFRWLLSENNSVNIWRRFTMDMPRMRYAERLLGWVGVERAMRRENVIRANCRDMRYVRGPKVRARESGIVIAGGRAAVYAGGQLTLYDLETGLSSSVTMERHPNIMSSKYVVQDRWLVIHTPHGALLLLDCVHAQLLRLNYSSTPNPEMDVSGAYLSIRNRIGTTQGVSIMRIVDDGQNGTIVHKVAVIDVVHGSVFHLCQHGASYIIQSRTTIQVWDMVTRTLKRTIVPPNVHIDFVWSTPHDVHDGFLVVSICNNAEAWRNSAISYRLRDGHASAIFTSSSTIYSIRDRACSAKLSNEGMCVDLETGILRSHQSYPAYGTYVDKSGAMAWPHGNSMGVRADLGGEWRALPEPFSMRVFGFWYGVCIVHCNDETEHNVHQVLRFDVEEPDDDAGKEAEFKIRIIE